MLRASIGLVRGCPSLCCSGQQWGWPKVFNKINARVSSSVHFSQLVWSNSEVRWNCSKCFCDDDDFKITAFRLMVLRTSSLNIAWAEPAYEATEGSSLSQHCQLHIWTVQNSDCSLILQKIIDVSRHQSLHVAPPLKHSPYMLDC